MEHIKAVVRYAFSLYQNPVHQATALWGISPEIESGEMFPDLSEKP